MSRFHLKSRLSPSRSHARQIGKGLDDRDNPCTPPHHAYSPGHQLDENHKTQSDSSSISLHKKKYPKVQTELCIENLNEQFRKCNEEFLNLESVRAFRQHEIGQIKREIVDTVTEMAKYTSLPPTLFPISRLKTLDFQQVHDILAFNQSTRWPIKRVENQTVGAEDNIIQVIDTKTAGESGDTDSEYNSSAQSRVRVPGGSRDSFYRMADAVARAIVTTLTGKSRFQPYPDRKRRRLTRYGTVNNGAGANPRFYRSWSSAEKLSHLTTPHKHGRMHAGLSENEEEENKYLPLDLTVRN